ncbi:PTS sugar transporter subunit IIA [Brachybacterium fresconis]|uniref:Ascorbate-specific PTS system EIIA component n=1 Tax=Brachybacterium fresconis TaxID=173363 RepID=A0ABS4YN99_9MICO|nr:PTS sugar transporter subunit IIA [Brachybacterium fresconis]MBP2410274.1 mannitol/fructose-specific phosphotransferase system IIA component (Ntr-type) [Brachybacterium fresconis]
MSASLSQLVTDDHVVLGASADTWQEAIRQAALPLLRSQAVTEEYVGRMIDVVDQFGPYIVLAPGVALAHAQPDGSVSRTSMSAATLPRGVDFGKSEHDPVRLVFCLAAQDSTSHLEALKAFVQIIRAPESVERLIAAASPQEFSSGLVPTDA